jgi:LEA14-like dessication related protein
MNKFKHASWLMALGLVALVSGCSTLDKVVKPPELSLSNAYITAMSLTDVQLAFDVDIKNSNPIGLSMAGLSYTLQVQDKPMVKGALNERLEVGANGSSRVKLPFTLRYEDIFGTLIALRDNKELRYQISGEADFGLVRLPYSKTGTFALPTLPTISVESLRVNQLNLSGVDLSVTLKVANANAFPIRLDGLDYQLKLGDAPLFKGASAAPLSVQANAQGQLLLNLSLNYAQVGALFQTLRNASSMPIEFNSQMKLPGLQGSTELPYNWKGSVPLFR